MAELHRVALQVKSMMHMQECEHSMSRGMAMDVYQTLFTRLHHSMYKLVFIHLFIFWMKTGHVSFDSYPIVTGKQCAWVCVSVSVEECDHKCNHCVSAARGGPCAHTRMRARSRTPSSSYTHTHTQTPIYFTRFVRRPISLFGVACCHQCHPIIFA